MTLPPAVQTSVRVQSSTRTEKRYADRREQRDVVRGGSSAGGCLSMQDSTHNTWCGLRSSQSQRIKGLVERSRATEGVRSR
eukprot:6638037-Pyramimonas_sp.AAC.3